MPNARGTAVSKIDEDLCPPTDLCFSCQLVGILYYSGYFFLFYFLLTLTCDFMILKVFM